MDAKKTTSIVTIQSMTYGGEATGRLPDGRVVFVPYAMPGEVVRIRILEDKARFARAELLEVIEPSPQRLEPRCPHFGFCGGCHYQHMPYEMQLQIKTEILAGQLRRMAGLEQIPMAEPVPSPSPWNYRNHVQFHLTSKGKLGYLQPRSNSVLPIRECYLPEETLTLVWPQIEIEPGAGVERLSLRLGDDEQVLMVLVSPDIQPPEASFDELPISAVHLSPAGSLVMAGSDHLIMKVRGRLFYVSAGSFFQVNTVLAEKMVEHLLENLPPGGVMLDVYCGVGLFSAFLAPRVERLVGIELSPQACDDFVANLDEFDNVELYEASAGEVLPALDVQPRSILVDPPRAGLERPALEAILELAPAVLAYVSCDPSTLGRDARRLIDGGYRLEKITLFDLFPQTYHIESISIWTKDSHSTVK
jgi:23S rRNA (uracil1939-C5)-methyltransferase